MADRRCGPAMVAPVVLRLMTSKVIHKISCRITSPPCLSISQSIFIHIRQPEPIVARAIHIKRKKTQHCTELPTDKREKRETKSLLERDICCRSSHQYFSAISSNRGRSNLLCMDEKNSTTVCTCDMQQSGPRQDSPCHDVVKPAYFWPTLLHPVLPHCTECRRDLAMKKPSVRLSNAWIVTTRKKDLSRFLYNTKDHLAWFSEKIIVGGPIHPSRKFWVNWPPLKRNRRHV